MVLMNFHEFNIGMDFNLKLNSLLNLKVMLDVFHTYHKLKDVFNIMIHSNNHTFMVKIYYLSFYHLKL